MHCCCYENADACFKLNVLIDRYLRFYFYCIVIIGFSMLRINSAYTHNHLVSDSSTISLILDDTFSE